MARPRALSERSASEARRLLAAGTSAKAVARRFGCDDKTIGKLLAEARSEAAAAVASASSPGSAPVGDDYEQRQRHTLDRITRMIDTIDEPRELARLAKAQSELIKALRLRRVERGGGGIEDETAAAAADRVKARLRHLDRARAPVVVVSEAVDEASHEVETGT